MLGKKQWGIHNMSVQTTYTIEHAQAFAGMVFSLEAYNTISKLNKGSEVIPYGLGVVTDTDNGAKLPVSGSLATQFNGVAMYEINRAQADGDVAGGTVGRDFTVVTHGEIWVTADLQVAKDDPVYLIVSDGSGTKQGLFSNVIGAAATLAVLIPGAKWTSSTTGATQLAKISLGIGG